MILGFTGRMGSGKNTAAEKLAEMFPEGKVVEISFARKLKESVCTLFGCSMEELEKWKNDPDVGVLLRRKDGYSYSAQSFREFLQVYGTEAHRDVFGADFWLDAALPLDGDYADDIIYVVTDVRFPNEAQRVRDLGGKVITIIGGIEDTPAKHRSEEIPQGDFLIDNVERNDDFLALKEQLYYLVEGLSPSSKPAEPSHTPEFSEFPKGFKWSEEEQRPVYSEDAPDFPQGRNVDEPREYIIVITETCRLIV